MSTATLQFALLRFPDLVARGVVTNRMTLRRWMALPFDEDPFPQPIVLGKNSIAWRAEDVSAWLDRRQKRGAEAR